MITVIENRLATRGIVRFDRDDLLVFGTFNFVKNFVPISHARMIIIDEDIERMEYNAAWESRDAGDGGEYEEEARRHYLTQVSNILSSAKKASDIW